MAALNLIFAGIGIVLLYLAFSSNGEKIFNSIPACVRTEAALKRIHIPYMILL